MDTKICTPIFYMFGKLFWFCGSDKNGKKIITPSYWR